jgi:hypothetical protein
MAWRLDKLVESPVLKDEAHEEHENSKCPEDGDGRNLAILSIADPEPSQQKHWKAIDGP